MDYEKKWKIIGDIGEGGQGKVHRVIGLDIYSKTKSDIIDTLRKLASTVIHIPSQDAAYEKFSKALSELVRMQDPSYHSALKVLHQPQDARDANLAKDRIKREIKAMSENLHPNLIRILDFDPDSTWYVSQFYEKGTLDNNKDMFKGDFPRVLRAIRPLVEGVARLHKKGYVHRDIKPQNIFINRNDELILGDFGLIYFADAGHTRISAKYENVGSRDWMPAWAMGMRIEDIKPNFDIFSLGKVLWSMVSGKSILPLWYFNRDDFNVELLFPKSRGIQLANALFAKCVVENEKDCMKDAGVLLSEIDNILKKIETGEIEPAEEKERIDEVWEVILVLVAGSRGEGYTAEQLAPRLNVSVTKAEYYLEKILEAGLLEVAHYVGGAPSEYYLSSDGRAYLVENNLI